MEKMERIELLNKVANTINHDSNGMFVQGETERLDLIGELLKGTDYKLTVTGLCHMYSKLPIDEMTAPITIISSHIDTHRNITEPFSERATEKKMRGTYDNSITNAAVISLMLENRLPDNVVVAFTGNEEYGMQGARAVSKYLKARKIDAKVIVIDVTEEGWDEKSDYSFENSCNNSDWTAQIRTKLGATAFKSHIEGNNEDDETCEYSSEGFECFSLCIPTKGHMHSNKGLKARIKTFNNYIECLCIAVAS